jgi:hypothetical protein
MTLLHGALALTRFRAEVAPAAALRPARKPAIPPTQFLTISIYFHGRAASGAAPSLQASASAIKHNKHELDPPIMRLILLAFNAGFKDFMYILPCSRIILTLSCQMLPLKADAA